jgi:hypothetical protein
MDALDALKAERIARRTTPAPPARGRSLLVPCAWCWALTVEGWKGVPKGEGWLCGDCRWLLWEQVERQDFIEQLRAFYQIDGPLIQVLRERFPELAEECGLSTESAEENPFLGL